MGRKTNLCRKTTKSSKKEGWEQQPAKNAQKDKDARWTKKNDASFFGYKNHLGVDKAHTGCAAVRIALRD